MVILKLTLFSGTISSHLAIDCRRTPWILTSRQHHRTWARFKLATLQKLPHEHG